MRREPREAPVVVVEKSDAGLGPFFWGLLFGAGVALLFAPQSGEETRRLLKTRGRRLLEAAEEKATELQEMLAGGYEDVRRTVGEGVARTRQRVDERRQAARDAVEASKAATHSAREELERRLAEARAARGRTRAPEREEPGA
ncbi:MAG: YtxH domain-containing protein, partial [Gemmatimonadetes bacterium]|nr:YtxH domain-containing protein [Gemmatimonadota bacterium]